MMVDLLYLRFTTGVMKPGQSFDDYILWDEYRENILFRKFDDVLQPERNELLFREFDAMDEMVEPGVPWVHDLSAYVPTREVM